MISVQFKEWQCQLVVSRYGYNMRTRFDLISTEDGCPVATASVNLPDEPLVDNEIAIKDYSENTGMCQALVDAGVIAPPHRQVPSGHVVIPICNVLKLE